MAGHGSLTALLVVAACATSHESAEPPAPRAPDLQGRPDAELLVAVVGDAGGRLDVWAQLATEVAYRLPDLVIVGPEARTSEAASLARELFATATVIEPRAAGFDYGFAHVTAHEREVVIEHDRHGTRVVIDRMKLSRADAMAIVRMRRDTLSVDAYTADGLPLPAR